MFPFTQNISRIFLLSRGRGGFPALPDNPGLFGLFRDAGDLSRLQVSQKKGTESQTYQMKDFVAVKGQHITYLPVFSFNERDEQPGRFGAFPFYLYLNPPVSRTLSSLS